MNTPEFTKVQANHALDVVLNLMKERRYFLHLIGGDFDPRLDPEVFGPAFELDNAIREIYVRARVNAEEEILSEEAKLGVTPADLRGNRQRVQCNIYTGGLDICGVYPLTAFLKYAPESPEALDEECFQYFLDRRDPDNVAPSTMRGFRRRAGELAEVIWTQLQEMREFDKDNTRCVVLMQTRFACKDSDTNHDFMQSRTRDMQQFPHALGYFFQLYSMMSRVAEHDIVVFSTSRKSHVGVYHWRHEPPVVRFDRDAGYTCPVMFATVL